MGGGEGGEGGEVGIVGEGASAVEVLGVELGAGFVGFWASG